MHVVVAHERPQVYELVETHYPYFLELVVR